MKTTGKIGNNLEKDLRIQSNFSSYKIDFKNKQIQDQNFVVPWQMVEKEKKESVVN